MTLEPLLSNSEVIQYLKDLEDRGDLQPGSNDYWIYASLFQLTPLVFTKAITALSREIIDISSLRGLSAITDKYVEDLIASKGAGITEAKRKERQYITEHFPAYVNIEEIYDRVRFKTKFDRVAANLDGTPVGLLAPLTYNRNYATLGDHEASIIMSAEGFDPASLLILPEYDLSRFDASKYYSYAEAVETYFAEIDSNTFLQEEIVRVRKAVEDYEEDVINRSIHQQLVDLVNQINTHTLFLRSPSTNDQSFRESFLGFVVGKKYRIARRSVIKEAIDDFLRVAAGNDGDDLAEPGLATYDILFTNANFLKYSIGSFRLEAGSMEREWTRFRTLHDGLEAIYKANRHGNAQGKINMTIYLMDQISDLLLLCQRTAKVIATDNRKLKRKEPGTPVGLLLPITYAGL